MQFTRFVLAAAAFVSSVNAALILTSPTYAGITVGKAFNISYSGATGPVTLTLKNGPETNLHDVEVIQSGLPAPFGSYTWTPSSSLPADTYAIEITDGSSTNYGARFQLLGATASASSSSSAFSAPTTTSSGVLASSTGFSNSTASATTTGGSKTTSKTSPSKTGSATGASSTTSVPGGNSAAGLASPLAMVLLAFAAVLSLN